MSQQEEDLRALVAKLEKKIASLESERKSFGKGKADSEFRLNTIQHDIQNNEVAVARI